jgi:DNA invertase Pin-like site-specific DNA recombinase
MKLAFSYIRFSKGIQGKGDSLRRQTALRDAWLDQHPDYTLDTALSLKDLGVSSFRGRHARKGNLADFLEAVRQGRVPKGSVLLIEEMDRLFRDRDRQVARDRFNDILRAGVDIVTLVDGQHYTRRDANDLGKTLIAIIKMWLAGEESRKKSERLRAGWQNRRSKARTVKATGVCPAWLRPTWKRRADGTVQGTKDAFEVITERAEAVRQIFMWAAEGFGTAAITKKCNKTFPPMGKKRSGCWTESYVRRILSNRAVLGELQLYQTNPLLYSEDLSQEEMDKLPTKVPAGDPLPGYYPAIVPEELFHRARGARRGRRGQRGPTRPKGQQGESGPAPRNLFTGIMFSANDDTPMHVLPKGKKGVRDANGNRPDRYVLVSSGARLGQKGSAYVTLDYEVFEAAFLSLLRGWKPEDVLPADPGQDADGEDEVTRLKGELAELDHKLQSVKAKHREHPDSEALLDLIVEYENDKKAVAERLEEAQAIQVGGTDKALDETQSLLDLLANCPPDELPDLRTRIKGALRRLIREVRVLIVPRSRTRRTCVVQAFFAAGTCQEYTIDHQSVRPSQGGWCVVTTSTGARADLRDREETARVEEQLKQLPPTKSPVATGDDGTMFRAFSPDLRESLQFFLGSGDIQIFVR